MPSNILSHFLLLLALLASSPVQAQDCCGCDCCGCGDDTSALLAALLGGGDDNLSLGNQQKIPPINVNSGRRRRATAAGSKSVERPKFHFGKDDPTPFLMGWPIGQTTKLKQSKESTIADWYRHAYAKERARQRAKAKARPAEHPPARRQRRLAPELLRQAFKQATRLRRVRQKEALAAWEKEMTAAPNDSARNSKGAKKTGKGRR